MITLISNVVDILVIRLLLPFQCDSWPLNCSSRIVARSVARGGCSITISGNAVDHWVIATLQKYKLCNWIHMVIIWIWKCNLELHEWRSDWSKLILNLQRKGCRAVRKCICCGDVIKTRTFDFISFLFWVMLKVNCFVFYWRKMIYKLQGACNLIMGTIVMSYIKLKFLKLMFLVSIKPPWPVLGT